MWERFGEGKLCVSKLCVDKLWAGGREAEEEAAAGYRTKNENPTQRCGEKMLSQILPRQLPACPSRNKVDFCQNQPYFDKNRPYFLTGNDGNQKRARLSFQDKPH